MKEVPSTTPALSLLDSFGIELTKLQVKHGDVLVMHIDEYSENTSTQAEALRNALYGQGVDDVLILVLAHGNALEVLDEDAMGERGWVRSSSA